MFASEDVQRWVGRSCLLLAGSLAMIGYYFANVRFMPLVAGFAILAGVCYSGRLTSVGTRPLRTSGHHHVL